MMQLRVDERTKQSLVKCAGVTSGRPGRLAQNLGRTACEVVRCGKTQRVVRQRH
jgi:hypothetical protein